ncbi:hypothetical protein AJ80_06752 [Polytolypa hystricis UAMH7299]|uniref:Actin interacting protein 3 C-terminal domain-containing protein n=1 Tax=Polytolypa hystricis (strain UAMH7299) TaxID=1447883 RepID=A0A2B7XUN7_POLH7|nr:hypothetical protein AJ80_06752 [Polytolypa hystricis UAMH7299]
MASAPTPGGGAVVDMMNQMPMGSRTSSGSGKASSSRGAPDKQLSQIEKSVTHLLVATKQLLETLTQWSRQQASESEVSDVYVRLGYEFNLACRAFGAIGVDTSDLGPVPDLLRAILEDTLSQDASPQSLDRYLPRIRDIIINLLHGLKKKQAKLRSKQGREGRAAPPRQGSSGSIGAPESSMGAPDDAPSLPQSPPKRQTESRQGATTPYDEGPGGSFSRNTPPSPWSNERRGASFSEREASKREAQRSMAPSVSTSSLSSNAMQSIPILPPPSDQDTASTRTESVSNFSVQSFPHPPPPPPPSSGQDDAIGRLQRSGELERRASRRFSQYQIQKHLGASPNGVPVLPTQSSPIPNRGKDVRESMNAVRLRGSYLHGRQRSNNRAMEVAPSSNASATVSDDTTTKQPSRRGSEDSITAKTPTDKIGQSREFDTRDAPTVASTPSLPQIAERETPPAETPPKAASNRPEAAASDGPSTEAKTTSTFSDTSSNPAQFTPELSPPPGKEFTLFLQYKTKIKKYVVPEGSADLSIGRLQLAFIEKFAWNTHNNGVDLPEIYIQDPVSGVRHELEDLQDVKDRSVLVLNVEALDEVKKHFDEGVAGIRRMIQGVKEIVDGQGTAIERLSDRQVEAGKDIARLAAAPPPSLPPSATFPPGKRLSGMSPDKGSQLSELQSLRRDLAVLRQTYSTFSSDIAASMSVIRAKASSVKSVAVDVAVPSFEGDAGRARVNAGKKELADESEKIVARVDDLQDLVEDLRKDVVTRGVRPLPRQLEAVGRDISTVTKELKKMQDFLKREKPTWTKIWEKELQQVCEERDQLTMQEDLAVDLEDDLDKAAQTFALVEQATKQQSLDTTNGPATRNVSRNFPPIDQSVDPAKAKDTLLGEVRALQPNHEDRLEAIERAERNRQKELENRKVGVFQKELDNFVNEGKLKKSGGVEELERMRKQKDEETRKEVWERQQVRLAEMEKMEQEAAAAEAAEGAEGAPDSQFDDVSAGSAGEEAKTDSPDGSASAVEAAAVQEDKADAASAAGPAATPSSPGT